MPQTSLVLVTKEARTMEQVQESRMARAPSPLDAAITRVRRRRAPPPTTPLLRPPYRLQCPPPPSTLPSLPPHQRHLPPMSVLPRDLVARTENGVN